MMIQDWDRYFSSLIGDELLQVPGLALVVYHEGREVYRFAGGIRRFRPEPLPMAMDSRFRIASVSKMFTVFTLMQLVEEGRLSLDDDVSAYLGFRLRHPAYDDIPVTVRMLASHTSGLRDGKVYSIPPFVSAEAFFQPTAILGKGTAFCAAGRGTGTVFYLLQPQLRPLGNSH
mgnify:CR=1 FL=1